MTDDRPAGAVLAGMRIVPLPDGHIALSAIVLVKGIDRDGRTGWYTRYTDELTAVECLGALRAAVLLEEREVLDAWVRHDEEDEC